jgi:recombination protein RecA
MTNHIERALTALGKGAVRASQIPDLEVMPTDSIALNEDILACGGFPRGRIIEVRAKPSAGKSTFMQWVAGQIQKRSWDITFANGEKLTRPGSVCWFDAEGTLMSGYASSSGMDLVSTVVPSTGLGNDFLHKLKIAIALDVFDLIIIDSMQAVVPDAISEVVGQRSMHQKLAQAVMWSQFFNEIQGGYKIWDAQGKVIQGKCVEHMFDTDDDIPKEKATTEYHRIGHKKCCLVFISHAKVKIEAASGPRRPSFGAPKTDTSGGEEKNFAFSLRLEIIHIKNKMAKKDGERILKYREVKFKSTKNKLGIPLRDHNFFLGVDGRLILDKQDLVDIDDEADEVIPEEGSSEELMASAKKDIEALRSK